MEGGKSGNSHFFHYHYLPRIEVMGLDNFTQGWYNVAMSVKGLKKGFKYRIYPTKSQERLLRKTLDAARWVYNETLKTRKETWEQRKEYLSLYTTNKLLTGWKRERPFLTAAYSQVLEDAQERVDLALKAFFRRVKAGEKPGYPRFRGEGRYNSITYPQFGFKLKDNCLFLSKIGTIKAVLHRPIEGKIKTCTISQTATGDWYVCFSCEIEPESLPAEQKAVGVDVGIESFATLSTGEKIPSPRFFHKNEKALAKAQRRLSNAKKGTSGRAKRRRVVAKTYKRIVNRRADFAHKLSRHLVNEYGIIVFENLDIKRMLRNHGFAKNISDAAWGQLVRYTTYKAEWAGRKCILVNPQNTSKMCSRCGTLVEKELSVRVHSCLCCGLVLDRDENAAINILRLGLQSVGIQSVEAYLLH